MSFEFKGFDCNLPLPLLLKEGIVFLLVCAVLCGDALAHPLLNKKAPEIKSSSWINTQPVSLENLRGKVTLVEFWTFGCYNCRNVEPFIKKWHEVYSSSGLVVLGVHSPEFGWERDLARVQKYVREKGIRHAVLLDNDFENWNRYRNQYWPAVYLVDKRGMIRYFHAGEGEYERTEGMIRKLLGER